MKPVAIYHSSVVAKQKLFLCSLVVLVISSFIGRAGDVGSLDMISSRALIFSNISVGTGSVLIRCSPEGMWCGAALRIMARKTFSPF